MKRPSINIITATYNSESSIQKLISSLNEQTDKDFKWIIADGNSTDNTLGLIREESKISTIISSQPDFGIYDALNKAIKLSTSDYYLVVGSDDYLYPNSIKDFRDAATQTNADMIVAGVDTDKGSLHVYEGMGWLYGAKAYVTAHSVGTLIRKSLHEKFGFYSKHLSITADSLFIKQACQNGISRYIAHFASGFFSTQGTSNTDKLHTLINGLHLQLLTEKHKTLQILIFTLRFLKNIKSINRTQ